MVDSNIKSINIKSVSTGETITVRAIRDGRGKVSYENLPAEVEVNIYHYTHEERWQNFQDVIMCLLTMHATLGGVDHEDSRSPSAAATHSLPSEQEYQ